MFQPEDSFVYRIAMCSVSQLHSCLCCLRIQDNCVVQSVQSQSDYLNLPRLASQLFVVLNVGDTASQPTASQRLPNRTFALNNPVAFRFAPQGVSHFHFISLQHNGLICLIVASYIASYIAVFVSKIIVQSRAIFQVSQPAIVVLLTQRNVINTASQPASPRIVALQKLLHSTERLDQCSVNNAATASQPTLAVLYHFNHFSQ